MKKNLLALLILGLTSPAFSFTGVTDPGETPERPRFEARCAVTSKGKQVAEEMTAYRKNMIWVDVVQNDGRTTKYRVALSLHEKLQVSIMDNSSSVSMGSWNAVDTVAKGSTALLLGATLTVSTGLEAGTSQPMLQLDCKVENFIK